MTNSFSIHEPSLFKLLPRLRSIRDEQGGETPVFTELCKYAQLNSILSSLALVKNKFQVRSVFNQRVNQNFIVNFVE